MRVEVGPNYQGMVNCRRRFVTSFAARSAPLVVGQGCPIIASPDMLGTRVTDGLAQPSSLAMTSEIRSEATATTMRASGMVV